MRAGNHGRTGLLIHRMSISAWATACKHLPAIDVARAGGWSGVETLQSIYQQADADTILRVVLEAGEVREVR